MAFPIPHLREPDSLHLRSLLDTRVFSLVTVLGALIPKVNRYEFSRQNYLVQLPLLMVAASYNYG